MYQCSRTAFPTVTTPPPEPPCCAAATQLHPRHPGVTLLRRHTTTALPAGLSLRTQELTAAFLLVRLFCSFMMEYDIHTLLDALTLAATGAWLSAGQRLHCGRVCRRCSATVSKFHVCPCCDALAAGSRRVCRRMRAVGRWDPLLPPKHVWRVWALGLHPLFASTTCRAAGWVIFSLRGPLKESYQADLDVTNPLLVAAPCLLMAIIAHPSTRHFILFRVRAGAAAAAEQVAYAAACPLLQHLLLLCAARRCPSHHTPHYCCRRSCGPSACTWRRCRCCRSCA